MILLGVLVPLLHVVAQESLPVITLQQSIDSALANGDNYKILQGSLSVARAQHAENISKNSLSLAGSLGAGYNELLYNSASLLSSKSTSLGSSTTSAQGGQVGLGVLGPLTSLSISASPFSPPYGNTAGIPGASDLTTGLGLTVSQVIWSGYPGGAAQATVDKSLLNLQGQELSTESGRLGLIYQVKQAYFAMFTAIQDLSSKRQVRDRQNALLDQIKAVYNLKQASEVDLKTAQINAHSAEIDVQTSAHTLRLARIRLAIIMALPTDKDFTVAQPPNEQVPAATLQEAISVALSRRVDLKLIELSRRSNAVDLAVARGLASPTVSVGGGVDVVIDNTANNSYAGLANVGVKISMPGSRCGRGSEPRGRERTPGWGLCGPDEPVAEVDRGGRAGRLGDHGAEKEKVDLAQQTAENDDLLVDVYKIQSRNGTASTQDLLTASVNAANAHSAAVQAQAGAQLAVLQLLSVMGY